MKSGKSDVAQLAEAVDALRGEVARLSQRMADLEKVLPGQTGQAIQRPVQTSKVEHVSEELLVAIGAAVAAYLGVKPHIRQIRLVTKNPWGLQGRVTIQASHILATHFE